MSVCLLFVITFVSAGHVITTSENLTSFSVNQTVQYIYNITVNNTAVNETPITQINITLPSAFAFTATTNGTSNDSASLFEYDSTNRILSWTNLTGVYIVNSSLWEFFWFNASVAVPGSYNLTITTVNTTGSYSSNLSVTINDTGAPVMNYISPIAYANLSSASVLVNVSVNDTYSSVSKVNFSLYNSTWYLLNETIVSATGGTTAFANMTFSQNITDGQTYYVNITANDSAGNLNSTALTRVFSIDTTYPQVSLIYPTNTTYNATTNPTQLNYSASDSTLSACWYSTNSTVNKTAVCGTNITGLVANNGSNTWTIYSNDSANNVNSSSIVFTLDTGVPVMSYISPIAYVNLSAASVSVNVSVNDTYSSVSKVNFSLYNSTWYLLNQTIVSATGGTTAFANMTFSQNITDGMTYYVNITANDSVGNLNSTTLTRVFTIDTTAPTVTSLSPADSTSTTLTSHNFTYNVSDSIMLDNCSLIFNEAIIGTLISPVSQSTTLGFHYPEMVEGTYVWYINCTDNAGNRANSSSRTITITVPVSTQNSGSSGSSSSGGGTSLVSLEGLSGGYSKALYLNGISSFKVSGETHSLRVGSITANQVKVIVYSTPQEALLSIGQEKKFDLNADGKYDLSVKLVSIDTTKVSAPKANLILSSITESIVSDSGENVVQGDQNVAETEDNSQATIDEISGVPESNNLWLWIVIGVVIILVVIILVSSKSKKVKNKKRYMTFGY